MPLVLGSVLRSRQVAESTESYSTTPTLVRPTDWGHFLGQLCQCCQQHTSDHNMVRTNQSCLVIVYLIVRHTNKHRHTMSHKSLIQEHRRGKARLQNWFSEKTATRWSRKSELVLEPVTRTIVPNVPSQSYHRRMFRSQTSDNMTDETAEVGRVREEKGRKKIREEKESEESRCRCAQR